MVDDGSDATVRQDPDRAGARGDDDVGSAATAVAPPTPAPASPASAPSTRPLGKRTAGGATLAVLDSERYTLGSLIGQGGMGEVVLAFDEQIGREVAVKRIRADAPSGEELARFVREARVQGRLEHPAVVPVHDLAFDKDGKPYFVMKRLSGTTMAELLAQLRAGAEPDEALARRRLLRAFADVCLAVEFAHSCGHHPPRSQAREHHARRLRRGLRARLGRRARGDRARRPRGAARSQEHDLQLDTGETRAGTVLGTPAYMAPGAARRRSRRPGGGHLRARLHAVRDRRGRLRCTSGAGA